MPRVPRFHLSVYRIDGDPGSPIDGILDTAKASEFSDSSVQVPGAEEARLFVRGARTRTPTWKRLLDPALTGEEGALYSASASALLVVRLEGVLMAVSFGHGYCLLRPDKIDRRFGLITALNLLDPEKLRTVARLRVDSLGSRAQEQMSRDVGVTEFGLDVARDLLTGVSGAPADEAYGKRIAGREAISLNIPVTLDSLSERLAELEASYGLEEYKQHLPWIDNIRPVKNPVLRGELDQALVECIRETGGEGVWMSPPDIGEWDNILGFRYGGSKKKAPLTDIHLTSYLQWAGGSEKLTAERLRHHPVICYRADTEQEMRKWSAYRCLNGEIEHGGSRYLLADGQWYDVDEDYVEEVTRDVRAIPPTDHPLPPWTEPNEADYNDRVANSVPGLLLLDKLNISYGGGHSKVEVCDLLDERGAFYFVKRYGGSSVLSHLWGQGLVSARLLAGDRRFRGKVREILTGSHLELVPDEAFDPRGKEIAFCVGSASTGDLSLPFFSRVVLRDVAVALSSQGYTVTLTKIQVEVG